MPKDKVYPSDAADKFVLRLPPGMRDEIAAAAKESGRSMNAEIVDRLHRTFIHRNLDRAEFGVNLQRKLMAETQARLEEQLIRSKGQPTIFLLLDSSGYPISWAEIGEYLRAVGRESGQKFTHLSTEVITPDMESNSRRAKEVAALARRLRKTGKSGPITVDQPVDDEKGTKNE